MEGESEFFERKWSALRLTMDTKILKTALILEGWPERADSFKCPRTYQSASMANSSMGEFNTILSALHSIGT